jgi:hypothetical protein
MKLTICWSAIVDIVIVVAACMTKNWWLLILLCLTGTYRR